MNPYGIFISMLVHNMVRDPAYPAFQAAQTKTRLGLACSLWAGLTMKEKVSKRGLS